MSDYKSILSDAGYLETKGCSCGGVRQEKFKKDSYTVYVQVRKQTFRIKQNNNYITLSQPLSKLNETLAAQAIRV